MQIVCESCGAVGAAAAVEVVESVVQLVCAGCGHANVAGGAASEPPSSDSLDATGVLGTGAVLVDTPNGTDEDVQAGSRLGSTGLDVGLARVVVAAARRDAGHDGVDRGTAAREGSRDENPADDAVCGVEPSDDSPPQHLPPVKCPKCGHRQDDDRACHRCGLVFALVSAHDRPWERLEPHQEEHAPRARALWFEVERAAHDPATHAAFVDFCRQCDLLGFAAMRYRHWMADHPNDALSRSYLDRVVRDAQALVHAMAVGDDPFLASTRRWRNFMLIAVGLFCFVAMIWVVRTMASRGTLVP